jgi:hypothetical protein
LRSALSPDIAARLDRHGTVVDLYAQVIRIE